MTMYSWYFKESQVIQGSVLQAVRRSAPQTRPPVTVRVWNQRTVRKTSCPTEDLLWPSSGSHRLDPEPVWHRLPQAQGQTPGLSEVHWPSLLLLCVCSVCCSSREEIWSTSSVSRPWARGWGSSITRWERLSSSTWDVLNEEEEKEPQTERGRRGGKVTLLNRPL